MSTDQSSTPRVPDVENPQPTMPLTEDIRPGTANDPPVETVEPDRTATLTVDGESVTVSAESTLLDATEETDTDDYVPALCSYDEHDEIGPRSECRTCMVETEEHGVVPSCSFPAQDGMTVRTDTTEASEARDVNLDLLLSNHNLRCTTCGKNGRCELQDVSIENDVVEPRYGVFDDRDAYEPLDDSSPFIQIDRNKCILCNRCVEACNDVQVEGVLRIEGSGEDTRIGFQNDAETMMDSTCVSCGHCATVCPTGALVEQGLTDAATIPLPGFTQENSIGKTVEAENDRFQPGPATPMKGDQKSESAAEPTAESPPTEDD
ncbi:2Fe-2S iron-sulfur cluster-binding protein [Halococcus saccharolyticus]|nr:2Fe-2S iron-sulfur cluster-binding protein [Halococcus saccharolyticus]